MRAAWYSAIFGLGWVLVGSSGSRISGASSPFMTIEAVIPGIAGSIAIVMEVRSSGGRFRER